jgi:hypothetical protein
VGLRTQPKPITLRSQTARNAAVTAREGHGELSQAQLT